MVTRYVILADTNKIQFKTPKQLIEINGERLIERTIRLLKERGIEDITITSHDKRFDGLGVKRYAPLHNDYDPDNNTGYWLNCFTIELLDAPVVFLFGDVYYSEDAMDKIVYMETTSTLYFCTYENNSLDYAKEWDESFAYKVVDYELFKKKIEEVKQMYDEGKCDRNPLVWELYRHIHNEDINWHKMTKDFVAINDETCDIDEIGDIEKMKNKIERKKEISIVIPYYNTYELTCKLLEELRKQKNDRVEIILVDDGCNETRLDEFKDVAIVKHLKDNTGGAGACNIGIDMAQGDYIGFIDSDDMISKDYISTLLETIDNHKEDVIFMDWQDIANGIVVHHPDNYAPWKAIYSRNIIPRFVEGMRYSYDVPFYDRLNSKPYSKYYIDKVLYYYYSNREGNLTSIKEKLRRERLMKCRVIEEFTLQEFAKLENIKRAGVDVYGKLFVNDEFECDEEMAKYLTGGNEKGKVVVKIIEVPVKLKSEAKKVETPKEEKELIYCGDEQTQPQYRETKPKKKKIAKK